jgi:DNA-binding IclR family transcriptional regulator
MPLSSFNVLVENELVELGPNARFRPSGEITHAAKSAIRALDVLEILGKVGKPMRAVEIARALQLSASSADQLLKTMVDSAYLLFDPVTKRYQPSFRAARFGHAIASSYFAPDLIDLLIERTHELTGELVGLFTSQGSFMQVIGTQASTPWPLSNQAIRIEQTALGLRLPLFGSSSGTAWLASQDEKALATALRLCRRELAHQAIDAAQIARVLQRVRRQGYAFGGINTEDMLSISTALPPCPNGVVLVLSIFGQTEAISARHEMLAGRLLESVQSVLGAREAR